MDKQHQKPFVLRIRPAGPTYWTWDLCRAGVLNPEPLAEGKTWNLCRTMEAVEERAREALGSFLDSDQVEIETFKAGDRRLEDIQRDTNIGEVRAMNQKNELQVQQSRKMANVRQLLERSKGQIAAALPNSCTPERMMRITATAIQKTPALLDCDPLSLIAAVMECAQLGLEPNTKLGHAHLVPFHNKKTGWREVQMIPGFTGLIELAVRSGKVSSIKATIVHEKDQFQYEEGLAPRLIHVPSREADKGEIVAAYAVARMTNGQTTFSLMWKVDIDKIKDGSPAGRSGPWVTHYEEMAKKTAIRRLCKTLPVSAVQQALQLREQADLGVSQGLHHALDFDDAPTIDADSTPEETPEPPKPKAKKKAAAKSSGKTDPSEEPDPSAVQLDEYQGMLTAAESLTDVDEVEKLAKADTVLNVQHRARILEAARVRRKDIHASRGERSNEKASQ